MRGSRNFREELNPELSQIPVARIIASPIGWVSASAFRWADQAMIRWNACMRSAIEEINARIQASYNHELSPHRILAQQVSELTGRQSGAKPNRPLISLGPEIWIPWY